MNNLQYGTFYKNYLLLIEENKKLKARIKSLEKQLLPFNKAKPPVSQNNTDTIVKHEQIDLDFSNSKKIDKFSPQEDKINLFMSLFKGRNDVYAKRWENRKGQSGYSPVCSNEWKPGICNKPKIKCSKCTQKSYIPLTGSIIEKHLLGDIVVGIYPMNEDESCFLLVIDFDKSSWQKDITVIMRTCVHFNIPYSLERSRSGNGCHIWFFFEIAVPSTLARRFGSALLTYSMGKRHELSFSSYDRLFPNQDTMPQGGFGNLIALPLQMTPRKEGNSVFINNSFEPFNDQWKFLSEVKMISENDLNSFIAQLGKGNELGILKNCDSVSDEPWKKVTSKFHPKDFPESIDIVKSGMLFIKKSGVNQKVLNTFKRFAAFRNPEFFKYQAMRMSTFNKPRVISCSEDFKEYLGVPRGCEQDITQLLKENNIKLNISEQTTCGQSIKVDFSGTLRQEQQSAVDALNQYEMGVLCATPAFGKTVIGAKLISIKKVNTLILVHRQQLLTQWQERLSEFLLIHEKLPEVPKKRGRKKKLGLIGQLGAGKNQLNSIIDIAIIQSINSKGYIKECIKDYGMIIIDECHHVPAFSVEQILKEAPAKYIYGLTATPVRPDGHHPILFFYFGPIRYLVDVKEQALKRPFEHYLIPRFTSFKITKNEKQNDLTIQEIYSQIINDEIRNQTITDDVIDSYKNGRNSLVITGRVAHVQLLKERIEKSIPDVISITGGLGNKKTTELFAQINSSPTEKPLVIIATGSFIGEGFDEPRLDTLFLAMPIAWKGTLQQYTGRLHRLYEDKKEVQIYDYVDVHVTMLEKMYGKRLKGYASIGYRSKIENIPDSPTDIIFDKNSFFKVYLNDIENARHNVVIVSPFITKKRAAQMTGNFDALLKRQVKVTIVTRPETDFNDKKQTALKDIFKMLEDAGVQILLKSNIHQKFAVVDNRISWYGSINLLSFGWSEESIMRLVSGNIANELLTTLDIEIG